MKRESDYILIRHVVWLHIYESCNILTKCLISYLLSNFSIYKTIKLWGNTASIVCRKAEWPQSRDSCLQMKIEYYRITCLQYTGVSLAAVHENLFPSLEYQQKTQKSRILIREESFGIGAILYSSCVTTLLSTFILMQTSERAATNFYRGENV